MHVPGLVTVTPDQPELLDQLATMVGTSFLEELWYATWLEALEGTECANERKLAITQAAIRADYRLTSPYGCVLTTEDHAGAANVFLRNELGSTAWPELETRAELALAACLTEKEQALLGPQAAAMESISDTSWMFHHAAPEDDFLYVISIGVDSEKRGTGAFGRLFKPLLAFADEQGIACYLDCYTDRLQQIYEHYGFKEIERLSASEFEIVERCMVRMPRSA